MLFVMGNICIIVGVIFTVNVFAGDVAINYEDEIDPVIDMLLNNEYVMDSTEGDIGEKDYRVTEEVPIYSDGVWKCGDCTDMQKLKLLYSETYDLDRNYDAYTEYFNMEIQIGLSLKGMRCITLKTEEDGEVRRVSGACAGEQVTLSVLNGIQCVVSIYG